MVKKSLLALVALVVLLGPMLGLLGLAVVLNPATTSTGAGCISTSGPVVGPLADDAPVPDRARAWIRKAARTCPDLPEVWIAAVMAQESDFQPDVFAMDRNGGTWGLFQINQYLWRQVYGPWDTDRDANGTWDIKQPMIHAEYGAKYLCNLLERVRDTRKEHPDWASSTELSELEALVVAHNAGPGRLETYPDIPAVTEEYLTDVRRRMRTWAADPNGSMIRADSAGNQVAASPSSSRPADSRVVMPLPAGTWEVTSPFGRRDDPFSEGGWAFHDGTDFAAPAGTPILAVAAGTVVQAEMVPGDAGTIVIEHRRGRSLVATRYKHMWADGIHVEPGDTVAAGQHIGDVGSSGYSTGPHLHLEVRPGGPDAEPIDPMRWLEKRGAVDLDTPVDPDHAGCGSTSGTAAGAPEPFRGEPGGRIEDPTGTGGWITRQMQHLLDQTQAAFPDSSWSCWYQSSGGQHPLGKACDVTFGNSIGEYPTDQQRQAGWKVAKWLKRYADELHVDYLIWQGKIWSVPRSDEGWRPYDGGGFGNPNDVTGGHYDHLHISVH